MDPSWDMLYKLVVPQLAVQVKLVRRRSPRMDISSHGQVLVQLGWPHTMPELGDSIIILYPSVRQVASHRKYHYP